MADKKISQLTDGGVPQATDEFVVDRAGADNFKLDWASLKTAAETNAVLDGDAAGSDLAGTYPSPTLAAIGVATGPIGDGTHVAVVTIDAKGRVTALTSTPITGAAPTGAAGGALAGTFPNPDLAAAVAGAGLALGLNILSVNVDGTTIEVAADALNVKAGGIGTTQLADAGPGATGPIGSATVVPVVTIDAKGRVTALSSATITGVAPGGAAGGVLSGFYPNPGFAVDMATQAELDAVYAEATALDLMLMGG